MQVEKLARRLVSLEGLVSGVAADSSEFMDRGMTF